MDAPLRVVLDTNVVFEGLTNQASACGLIVDLWRAKLLRVCVSDTIAYEYADVLSRKLSDQRWSEIRLVLQALLKEAELVDVYFSWRPASPDPGDDHVIDCAMNANALLVTSNIRDFKTAQQVLSLQTITPVKLLEYLTD